MNQAYSLGFVGGILWVLWVINASSILQSNARTKTILVLSHLCFVIVAPISIIIAFDLGLAAGAIWIGLVIHSQIG